MAAYSAVVSFEQLLNQLLISKQFPPNFPEENIEYLHLKISSLQSSVETIFPAPKDKRETAALLESQIREAIYQAQDALESAIAKSLPPETNLEKIKSAIDAVEKDAKELARLIGKDRKTSPSSAQSSESGFVSRSTKIVGQKEAKERLMKELMTTEDKLQIAPISGMAGIGKTTLAKSIYEDEDILKHFPIRAWVTVSQDYNVSDILSKLMASMRRNGQPMDNTGQGSDNRDLPTKLRQNLYDTRYLVVIDDMWDKEVWDRVRNSLPDDKKQSRIILTTRHVEVAKYAKPEGFRHEMRTLDENESWELLSHVSFDGNPCPDDGLKVFGNRITKSCGGLPLSITVVGGLLSQGEKSREYWESIADDVNDAVKKVEGAEAYKEILALSYIHLPGKLKGCFLYIGLFPEDSDIPVSKLVRLWVAEGFLALPQSAKQVTEEVADVEEEEAVEEKEVREEEEAEEKEEAEAEEEEEAEGFVNPKPRPRTMEQIGKESLESLIQRNLVHVRNLGSDSQIKSCGMHDTLRDLAVSESEKEKFFHSIRKYITDVAKGAEFQRRVSVHKNILMCLEEIYESTKSIDHARSLLYVGPHHHHPMPFCLTFDLLRVFDAFTVYFIQFPSEVIKLVHLRYLSFTYNGKLPSSISKLQKLQILIVRRQPKIIFVGSSFLPDEIWDMPQLRHLLTTESDLPNPKISEEDSVLFANLQSLSNVRAISCSKKVLRNMPNLRKLGMWVEEPCKVDFHLDELQFLEAFKFVVLNPIPKKQEPQLTKEEEEPQLTKEEEEPQLPKHQVVFEPRLFFPETLRKLTLSGCGLPWDDIEVIRQQLPNLEVLKLRELAFQGEEWIPEDDARFRELKYLLIEYLDFKIWWADYSYFPKLERLIIKHCYNLEEMNPEIGDIGGLRLIDMVDCSPEAVEWAKEIKEKKKNKNKDLRVQIYSSWE